MKKLVIVTAAALGALAAVCAWGAWFYEGQWRSPSAGCSLAIAPNADVYVVGGYYDSRIRYYDRDGSFKGVWGGRGTGNGQFERPWGITVGPDGRVYVADHDNNRVQYFTPNGSFLGKWGQFGKANGELIRPCGITSAPDGTVYVADEGNERIQRFTATGSFLRKWGHIGHGPGEFFYPYDVGVSVSGNRVFVVDGSTNQDVQYFTRSGFFLGRWDLTFESPRYLTVSPAGPVFLTDATGHCVWFYSGSGSLLGRWGYEGWGPGEFDYPKGLAVSVTGSRVYITDLSARVQYFNRNKPAVAPTSLGRVKALFR
jgi:DNA-binding beta-propeller fold protein YncE